MLRSTDYDVRLNNHMVYDFSTIPTVHNANNRYGYFRNLLLLVS